MSSGLRGSAEAANAAAETNNNKKRKVVTTDDEDASESNQLPIMITLYDMIDACGYGIGKPIDFAALKIQGDSEVPNQDALDEEPAYVDYMERVYRPMSSTWPFPLGDLHGPDPWVDVDVLNRHNLHDLIDFEAWKNYAGSGTCASPTETGLVIFRRIKHSMSMDKARRQNAMLAQFMLALYYERDGSFCDVIIMQEPFADERVESGTPFTVKFDLQRVEYDREFADFLLHRANEFSDYYLHGGEAPDWMRRHPIAPLPFIDEPRAPPPAPMHVLMERQQQQQHEGDDE